MKRSTLTLLILVVVVVFVASQSIFFVGQAQEGLVLQFGEPLEPVRKPGINFKIPFIQNAVLLDKRIISFDIPKTLSHSSDQKQFELDNYCCWKITNAVDFVRSMRSERDATERLRNIVYSQLRVAIGSETLKDVVHTKRNQIMDRVLKSSNEQVKGYGVEIVDVRIKRTDLPNRDAVFKRMQADRQKMANQYRGEGEAANKQISSEAEKTRDIIIAKAQKESTILRGNAEAEAMKIFATALSTSPDFYEFVKSLEIYKKSFTNNTRFILSFDEPLFKYFQE